ncbi:hypothetical protein PVAP13_2NG544303 [Panicum virgatum]|uniref:Uncharacterized protein n=1 Tax=Panicum virgatum TaxID=38727 RepID=A0A8T0VVW1_PANVG|nr:hypothetical protein PVAP13_2NG544303 [Panicum virgatum]
MKRVRHRHRYRVLGKRMKPHWGASFPPQIPDVARRQSSPRSLSRPRAFSRPRTPLPRPRSSPADFFCLFISFTSPSFLLQPPIAPRAPRCRAERRKEVQPRGSSCCAAKAGASCCATAAAASAGGSTRAAALSNTRSWNATAVTTTSPIL